MRHKLKGPPAAADLSGLRSPVQRNDPANGDRHQVHLMGHVGHHDSDPETGPTVPRHSTLKGHASEDIKRALHLLNDGKSVREVAAATGLSKSKVGRLRSKCTSGPSGTPVGQSPPSPPTPNVSQAAVEPPPAQFRRSRRAFEAPPLNSIECWHDATEAERAKFVDAVGLWNLMLAAPEDHRQAFLDRLETAHLARKAVATASAPTSLGFPDLPDFLDRRSGRSTTGASS